MRITAYITSTYAQLDTWSRGTKQSQTKPISAQKPLPAKRNTALTSLFKRIYATTPQAQKQTQTNPIRRLIDRLRIITGQNFGYHSKAGEQENENAIRAWENWFESSAEIRFSPTGIVVGVK